MRTLTLRATDGRQLEARLILHGDRTHAGVVHRTIAPVLELVGLGARGRRLLATFPVDFVRESAGAGLTLGRSDAALRLDPAEVARLLDWIDGGGAVEPAPLVVVYGDELELGRVCAVLRRMPLELIATAKPGLALAALGRSPALAVTIGEPSDLRRFVRAAEAVGVPLIAIGCEDESALGGSAGVTRLAELEQRRLFDAVGELLDLV